jgi:hypothetical protein
VDDQAGFFLAGYPDEIARIGERLRAIARRAVPDAQERIRSGWALIGYDIPLGASRKRYFAFIAPERKHIHLGFEYGAWMTDPDRVLEGGGPPLRLKKVRFVTFDPGAKLNEQALVDLTREGALMAQLSRADRLAMALDRESAG